MGSATLARMRVLVESELGAWSGAWADLVRGQALPTPFLLPWWVEAAGGRPALVLCVEDGTLVGGAAFEVDRVGRGPVAVERVRSLGQGELAPDHLDVVAAPGRAAEVVERVLGWLHRPGSRVVDLDGLAADGVLATALAEHVIERVAAPFATLPPDVDDYLARLPGRLRSTVTRTRKRLDKAGGAGPPGAPHQPQPGPRAPGRPHDRALDALADLHDHRWAEESGFLGAWSRFRSAARAGMADGVVVVHEVADADGAVVATELDLVVAGRVAFYQAGRSTDRDWRGAGSVLRAAIIAEAVAAGDREYDLLRGDEDYKADWADARRELVRVRLGVGPLGRPVAAGAAAWRRSAPTLHRWQASARAAVRRPGSS